MPVRQVRVAAWNVQNFGAKTDVYRRYKGKNSSAVADFIAAVAHEYEIDVLLMMEVMRKSEAHLDNVMYALNEPLADADADWCYDWIRGATKQPLAVTPAGNIATKSDLAWSSSSHASRSEGYAIFWRDNQKDRFTMQRSPTTVSQGSWGAARFTGPAQPRHVLGLSLQGRRFRTVGPLPYVQAERPFSQTFPGQNMGDSLYPDVSKFATLGQPFWERVRRPAYVVLSLNLAHGAQREKMLPLMAYHAPSRLAGAAMGTYLSGLAKELYALTDAHGNDYYHARAFAAGDYNVSVRLPGAWTDFYRTYWRVLGGPTWNSGAGCNALSTDTHPQSTIITLKHLGASGKHNGPPIESNDLDDYEGSAIDNLFERGLANTVPRVLRLDRNVMLGGPFTGAFLQQWAPRLTKAMNAALASGGRIDPDLGPMLIVRDGRNKRKLVPSFANMTDWTAFTRAINRGYFRGDWTTGQGADARGAAVFTHDFVSDHLPVCVDFDITTP